jgi:hypothetical protein
MGTIVTLTTKRKKAKRRLALLILFIENVAGSV